MQNTLAISAHPHAPCVASLAATVFAGKPRKGCATCRIVRFVTRKHAPVLLHVHLTAPATCKRQHYTPGRSMGIQRRRDRPERRPYS